VAHARLLGLLRERDHALLNLIPDLDESLLESVALVAANRRASRPAAAENDSRPRKSTLRVVVGSRMVSGGFFLNGYFLVGILVGLVICGVIAAAIGPNNGWSSGGAFFMGLFLGLLGIIIVAVAKGGNPTPTELDQRRQWEDWNRYQAWLQQQQAWEQHQAWQKQQAWEEQVRWNAENNPGSPPPPKP